MLKSVFDTLYDVPAYLMGPATNSTRSVGQKAADKSRSQHPLPQTLTGSSEIWLTADLSDVCPPLSLQTTRLPSLHSLRSLFRWQHRILEGDVSSRRKASRDINDLELSRNDSF